MIKWLLVIVCTVGSSFSFAAMSPHIKISGKIKSFNEKYVVLEQGKIRFKLPRNLFPNNISPDQEISVETDR